MWNLHIVLDNFRDRLKVELGMNDEIVYYS